MPSTFRALALVPLLAAAPVLTPARPALCQPLPDRVPLAGTLVNDQGAPVAGALLSLRRVSADASVAFWGATTRSDEAGNFSFPDAETGDYYITVDAPGYATLAGQPLQWRADSTPARITISRLLGLILKLRAPADAPALSAGTPITVRLRPDDKGGDTTFTIPTALDGTVRVPDVKPGKYSVFVQAGILARDGFAILSLEVSEPNSVPREVILNQKSGALQLKLTDSLGRALGGASLSLAPATIEEARRLGGADGGPGEDYALLASGGNRNLLVSRDGDGTIDLSGLPPGQYAPRLFLPGYAFENLAPLTIEAGQSAQASIEAPSRRARTLTLQLRSLDGQPYTAGEVALRILPLAANGQMGGDPAPNPDDADDLPFFPSGPGGRRVLPDAQGRVELFPVKAGRYRIFAAPRSTKPGTNPPEAVPVDVTIGADGATATVIVPG